MKKTEEIDEYLVSVLFSEPKIPQSNNAWTPDASISVSVLFSEPKIPQCVGSSERPGKPDAFQCSSASRKFLNSQCGAHPATAQCVSVLFSEPKIPQSVEPRAETARIEVSVLFSEPKIPQLTSVEFATQRRARFSALQRAENSSIPTLAPASIHISDRDDHASSFLSLPGASP